MIKFIYGCHEHNENKIDLPKTFFIKIFDFFLLFYTQKTEHTDRVVHTAQKKEKRTKQQKTETPK